VNGVDAVEQGNVQAGGERSARWKRSIMSAHASGSFSVGVEPPPEGIDPSPYVVIGVSSSKTW
jgi:hypothetical protein